MAKLRGPQEVSAKTGAPEAADLRFQEALSETAKAWQFSQRVGRPRSLVSKARGRAGGGGKLEEPGCATSGFWIWVCSDAAVGAP